MQAEDDLRLLEKFQNEGRARTRYPMIHVDRFTLNFIVFLSRQEAYMNDFHIHEKRLSEKNFQDAFTEVELKPDLDELYHTSVDRAHARVPSE